MARLKASSKVEEWWLAEAVHDNEECIDQPSTDRDVLCPSCESVTRDGVRAVYMIDVFVS